MRKLALASLFLTIYLPIAALAQTTAPAVPVPESVYSIGTIAGSFLTAVIAVAAPIIAYYVVALIARLANGVGFSVDEAQRQRLQELVQNGLHALVARGTVQMQGMGKIEIGSPLARALVDYVQEHGPSTVAALAKNAASGSFEEAIVARANRALADPAVPTPPSITPPEGKPQIAAVIAPSQG